ncbi:MAG: leucine-rich repeat domain-containing protein [Pseudomonadota bacterium]
MTENDQYEYAVRRIKDAKEDGRDWFHLVDYGDLYVIPSEIAELDRLQTLGIEDAPITDIAPLSALTGLRILSLHTTQVADLSPLAALTGLQTLQLSNTPITDFSVLEAFKELKQLDLGGTPFAAPELLSDLPLVYLDLGGTPVDDAQPLGKIETLEDLDIGGTRIADMRPLAGFKKLGMGEPHHRKNGLNFKNCAATEADPKLEELSRIEDNVERTEQTLAYLGSLPPYPWPLPWLEATKPSSKPRSTPTGLRRLSLSDARHLLETDHPLIRGRCQRVVSEIDDALALQTLRIPNDPDALDAHNQVTQSLELAKALAVGLHEAVPADFTDQTLTEEEVSRFK